MIARRRLAMLTRALLVAGVLAGCADDSSTDGGSSTVASAPDSTTTAPPTPTDAPDVTAPVETAPTDTEPEPSDPDVRPNPAIGDKVLQLEELVALGVRAGDDRMFVVERAGRVSIVSDGEVVDTALDITDQTENEGERGLLGLAFSSDGSQAYVDFTDNDGNTVIAEYVVNDDGTFDADSRREMLNIDQPYPNHNGGDVVIGPDGMLYIGMGDGGAADDPERRALDTSELLGKILRIDPTPEGDQPYVVPDDNPFVGVDGARPEIWAIGVRNPWRFSFDSATGDLWIADVGQNQWEEVDHLPADADGMNAGRGVSLGWSAEEGEVRYNSDQPETDPSGQPHVKPVHVYEHGDEGCSISGGALYRGSGIAGLDGWYVFGDFCSGKVWALETLDDGTIGERLEIGNVPQLTAIASGPDGELWALSLDGSLYPVVAA